MTLARCEPTNAQLSAQVDEEFTCLHPHTRLVRRPARNESYAIVRQCERCGWTSPAVPFASYPGNPTTLPEMDRKRTAAWYEQRRQRYEGLVADRQAVWRTRYAQYLQSAEWQARRTAVMTRAKSWCEGCRAAQATEVHHLTYVRAGQELLFDLVAVCRTCHAWATESQGQGR